MRAVITVVGKDMVGIVATVATECAATNANILDVTQSVFEDDIFAMVMLVDVSKLSCPLPELSGCSCHARGYFQFDAPHLTGRTYYHAECKRYSGNDQDDR